MLFCPYYSEIAVTRVAAKIARSAVPQDAAELVAMAQKALFLAAPIALGLICPLVVILFALGDADFELQDVFASYHNELDAMRYAMSVTAFIFIFSILSFIIVSKTLPKDWNEAEKRNSLESQPN